MGQIAFFVINGRLTVRSGVLRNYIYWDALDARSWTWDELEAQGLTWDHLEV